MLNAIGKAAVIALGVAGAAGAAKAQKYAVIAYSETSGRDGAAWGYDDYEQAETDAIVECGSSDCAVVASVEDGCIALATIAEDYSVYGSAYVTGLVFEETYRQAREAALADCESRAGGYECSVQDAVCSFQ